MPKGGPDGGDGGNGGDVIAAGRPQRRVAARVPRPPAPAGRRRGRTAQGKQAPRRDAATTSSSRSPRARSCETRDGRACSPTSSRHGDTYARGAWRPGRPRQRPLPLERAPGAELRRAGRVRRGALAAARAQAPGRRRARRVPERREVDADRGGRARRSRRSPTTRSRRSSRTSASCASSEHEFVARRHPGAHRGRGRGPGPRPPVPPPRRAGAGARAAPRPRQRRGAAARRSRSACCSTSSAATSPSCSSGRGSSSARKADVATLPVRRHAHLGGHPRRARRAARRGSARWSTRPAPPSRSREAFVVLRPAEEGFSVGRDDDGAWRVTGRAAERVVAMADLTNPEALAYVHDRFRRMGVERALARAGAREGDLVRIGDDRARVRRGAPSMSAVVKVGTSSITGETRRARRRRRSLKLCGELAAARRRGPRGRARVLGRHRRRAAGARACTERPTDIGTLQAIAAVGQPRLMERVRRDPRPSTASSPARCCSPRTTSSTAPSTCTPARRCGGSSTSAWCPIVNENDTVADDEIRYGDNDRLAALVVAPGRRRPARAAHRHRRAVHRRPAPRRGGVAHRGDRRGRRRARGGRRWRRHATGGAAGWRASWRRRRSPPGRACGRSSPRPRRPASCSARSSGRPSAPWCSPGRERLAEPQALDRVRPGRRPAGSWSTTAPGARCVEQGRSLLPAGVRAVEGGFDADDAVEVVGEDGRPFAKGLVRYAGIGAAARGRVAGRATCPRASPARGHPPRRPRGPRRLIAPRRSSLACPRVCRRT